MNMTILTKDHQANLEKLWDLTSGRVDNEGICNKCGIPRPVWYAYTYESQRGNYVGEFEEFILTSVKTIAILRCVECRHYGIYAYITRKLHFLENVVFSDGG